MEHNVVKMWGCSPNFISIPLKCPCLPECIADRCFRFMLHTSNPQQARYHSMMTSSNGNIFRVTGHLCGNSPVSGEFPAQRPVTRSVDVLLSGVPDYFDRNKILSGYDLSHYQVPHCIRVFFYFVWFVFIHHNFQFYFKLCTYCNILDIYLS